MHLQGVDLSRVQLQRLIRGLPDLRHLSLRSLRLESAAPLAGAKRLQALSLHFCVLGGWTVEPEAKAAASGASNPDSDVEHAVQLNAAGVQPALELASGAEAGATAAASASTSSPTATPTASPLLDFRRELPAMAALSQLLLHDRVRLVPSAAAPLNAALFARMPRLKVKSFHQNLLAEPVGAAALGDAEAVGRIGSAVAVSVGTAASMTNQLQTHVSAAAAATAAEQSLTGAAPMEM